MLSMQEQAAGGALVSGHLLGGFRGAGRKGQGGKAGLRRSWKSRAASELVARRVRLNYFATLRLSGNIYSYLSGAKNSNHSLPMPKLCRLP